MSTGKRGRGRPRRDGADEEILAIAQTILSEGGYGALTVDAVADRAGVAKTTVYRRWPSKGALIAALIPPPGTYADIDAVLRDVESLLAPLADASADAESLGVIRAILRSRRPALVERTGNPSRADELLGALWMKLFVA
ncbi:MAG TPA: helix-turn-helix domain-containing protein [Thermoanaerobaculia bacterium]|nr:helix-turn-helix domain-containing protein [Thermoanaerobaculia bacterium]